MNNNNKMKFSRTTNNESTYSETKRGQPPPDKNKTIKKFADEAVQILFPVPILSHPETRGACPKPKGLQPGLTGTAYNHLWLCLYFRGFVIDYLALYKAIHSNTWT